MDRRHCRIFWRAGGRKRQTRDNCLCLLSCEVFLFGRQAVVPTTTAETRFGGRCGDYSKPTFAFVRQQTTIKSVGGFDLDPAFLGSCGFFSDGGFEETDSVMVELPLWRFRHVSSHKAIEQTPTLYRL